MLNDYVLGFSLFNGIRFLKDGKMYFTTNLSNFYSKDNPHANEVGVFGNVA
jgi:hypothetical protein